MTNTTKALKPIRRLSGKRASEIARTAAAIVGTEYARVDCLSDALRSSCVEAARRAGLEFWSSEQCNRVAIQARRYYDTTWSAE